MPLIRAISLASGSKGNCLFVEGGGVRLLVDAGISCRQIETRLAEVGVAARSIDAILITHEHLDHVSAVPLFARRFGTAVYASPRTACRPIAGGALRERIDRLTDIEAGRPLRLGELVVTPFAVSHDAVDPLAFRFETAGAALAFAADLGVATDQVRDRLAGCQALFCESNHDPEMLRRGPYSPPLKQRVAGAAGHLSNPDCRALIEGVHHRELAVVVLTHLSEKNNTPRLAYNETNGFFQQIGARTELRIAFQDRIGTPVEIG